MRQQGEFDLPWASQLSSNHDCVEACSLAQGGMRDRSVKVQRPDRTWQEELRFPG